jgi:PAS domain S-box-containing protein
MLKDDGHVVGTLSSGEDITDRKYVDELRTASFYTRSLIETSLDILITINVEGKITDVNEAAVKATGIPRGGLIGSDFSSYFTEPDKARSGYEQVLSGNYGYVKDYPLSLKHTSGLVMDVLYNAVVYKDQSGQVRGVFAAARNITERKRAEEATKEAQDTLVKAMNIKEEFLSFVSHDLKSPLHIIKRAMDLLVEEPNLDDSAKKHIELSLRQVARGLKFVDNLVNLKRLKSGDVKLELSKFRIHDLIDGIVKDYRFNLDQAGIELKAFGSGLDHEVLADQEKMGHVVGNIIDNAIKHTSKGGSISIDVRAEPNMLKVSISDTGEGIPPEKLKSIFEYYEQAKPSDKEVGVGLGLAIARYICEIHGGKIWAESEIGKGATINFIIPNIDACAEGKNILIVDDIADERTMTRNVLEKNSFRVDEAKGWEEAMTKIRSGKINAVLLDIQMPDMSGIEVLKLIRQERDARSLPVIIYSAKAFDAGLCVGLGANSCVKKGDGTDILLDAIKKVFIP